MRIENLHTETREGRARVAATMIWEDVDRPPQEIFFETDEALAEDLVCDPHAFIVASILPAMRYGEARLAIDSAICPELHIGLQTAMRWICQWYGPPRRPVCIEAKAGARLPLAKTQALAGSFLSGGIDSLATLRENHLNYPLGHPNRIKVGLLVHGFDIGGRAGGDDEMEVFDRAVEALQLVVEDADIKLIPVFTNVRHIDDDLWFWMYEFVGAALASVGHVFSNLLHTAYIASGFDISHMEPHATHPVLVPNFGSAGLTIRDDGVRHTRLDKVRLVAGWEAALQSIRVCTWNPPGQLNCGKCEKCVRTMTELLAVGKLQETNCFPSDDVTSQMLGGFRIKSTFQDAYFQHLIPPLLEQGRQDLVDVIQRESAGFQKRLLWEGERDWKGVVKKLDRGLLGGALFKTYKEFREQVKK